MREVFKVDGTGNRRVRMAELRKGDKFKIVTDDPRDGLYGLGHVVYTAGSDAYESKYADVWEVEVASEFDSTATRLCAS